MCRPNQSDVICMSLDGYRTSNRWIRSPRRSHCPFLSPQSSGLNECGHSRSGVALRSGHRGVSLPCLWPCSRTFVFDLLRRWSSSRCFASVHRGSCSRHRRPSSNGISARGHWLQRSSIVIAVRFRRLHQTNEAQCWSWRHDLRPIGDRWRMSTEDQLCERRWQSRRDGCLAWKWVSVRSADRCGQWVSRLRRSAPRVRQGNSLRNRHRC